ncbi:xaa-Pro aminopeptidase ApepP isoform X2 [Anabrus simplex]
MKTGNILTKLRALMKNTKYVKEPLQAYIVPSGDAHQSEYVADCDNRRAFISGFTGSAGTAVITDKEACLWTDGRYFLQATKEMDENWTLMKEGVPTTPTQEAWLSKTLPSGSRVGVDPALISYSVWKPMQTQLEDAGHHLVPVETNLVDLIWEDQPQRPVCAVNPLSVKYTGKTCKEKVQEVREKMKEKGATALVVTALDEVAWLLNLRGCDVPYNPVFFSFVIVTMNQVVLFVDEAKLNTTVQNHFSEEDLLVKIMPYEKVDSFLKDMVGDQEGKVWISNGSSYALVSIIPDKVRLTEITPIALMKAIKNSVEINGMINAHIKDAAALCCYFAWLENELLHRRKVTEISGAKRLEEFRKEQEDFVGLSFETISSSGPNGAIIHYSPSPETDRAITSKELYLCDSGGQYYDGTTDVTRTIHFGVPSQYEKECFTRVFKGQHQLGTAVFPSKIKGNCLDTLARKYLWDVGLDYRHGTGHGIGHYLNVHEGPMGISWRVYPDDPGLQEGMCLSNEPGYYEDGKFGIRLENIVRIIPSSAPHNFQDRGYLTFETITLVPIQTKMLDRTLLTEEEVSYLNDYHKECREKVGSLLKKQHQNEAYDWLFRETEPIV